MGSMKDFLKDLINSLPKSSSSVMYMISKLDDKLLEGNLLEFKIGLVLVFLDNGSKLAFRCGEPINFDFSKVDEDCLRILAKMGLLIMYNRTNDSLEYKLSDKGKDYLKKYNK